MAHISEEGERLGSSRLFNPGIEGQRRIFCEEETLRTPTRHDTEQANIV